MSALGRQLVSAAAAAASARWLTTGVVTSTSPLVVTVDGVDMPISGYVGDLPAEGDPVAVGVVRGATSVGLVVICAHSGARTALVNTADGGTHGVAATTANTGGASGDAFHDVFGTVAFDSTHSPMAYKLTPGISLPAYLEWAEPDINLDGLFSWECSTRFELYLPAYSSPSVGLIPIAQVLRLAGYDVLFWIDNGGYLTVHESGFGGVATSPVGTIPLNTWVRIECAFNFVSGGGTYDVRVYPSRSSTSPTWTAAGSRAWQAGTGVVDPGTFMGNIFGVYAGFEVLDVWIDNIIATDRAVLPGPA